MRRYEKRRGMVLLAVLIIITIGALIGATLLATVDAERSGAQTTLGQTQSRALAWSGAQVVMAELLEQRDALLDGQEPQISNEWELFEDDRGRTAVVRLLPIGPGGQRLVSESGKVDLNHASKEMLAALPGIGTEDRAQAIIDARPFSSVEELVRVDGFAADMLYGFVDTPEAFTGGGFADESEGSVAAVETPAGLGVSTNIPLKDLLTVFSFDPNVQAGLENPDKKGKLRVNLNTPWSDRLARAIEDQWGKDAVQVAKQIFESGGKFGSDAELMQTVRPLGVNSAEDLEPILDSVTTSDDMYRLGRIDVLNATPPVLAALPGIDLAAAYEMVEVRPNLAAEDRLSPLWMVKEGFLTLDEFEKIVDVVTTRSLQWRVRLEAGYRPVEAIGDIAGVAQSVLEGFAADQSMDAPLEDRVVYDIVIDVSSQRARVAYMRDVSLLDLARSMRKEDLENNAGSEQAEYESSLLAALGLDESYAENDPVLDAGELESSAGVDESVGPSWRDGSRINRDRELRRAERTANRSRRLEGAASRNRVERSRPTMPGEPVDRRIGRWKPEGGS